MRYDIPTRMLHAGIALGVSAQLGLSLFMQAPDDQDEVMVSGLPLQLFHVHEKIGFIVLALLALHWLWSASGHVRGGFGHLFPWFSGERIAQVVAEAQRFIKLELPDPDESKADNALAGAMHGLGLLAATGLAVTGVVIYFNLSDAGHMTPTGDLFHEIHETLSFFMWAYLIGHVAAAVLHKRMGHANVQNMFSFRK